MDAGGKRGFSLVDMVVVTGVTALFSSTLFPLVAVRTLEAEMMSVAARGKDIFVSITAANTERAPLGLRSVWPKTQLKEGERNKRNNEDIAGEIFGNSTDYFYKLYDGANLGTPVHAPYVPWLLDYSRLAGAGVPQMAGPGKLQPENNMWCIAGNLRDEMADIIPVLITRNVDCSSLHKDLRNGEDAFDKTLRWSQKYDTPFSNTGFVMVRKGGAIFKSTQKHAVTRVVYLEQAFQTTVEGHAPLVYLTPDGIANPQ